MEEQGTWAAQKHSEAGDGRPVARGVWTAKTVKRPGQQPAHPQYANYWAPLTRKRHTMPHSAQSQHANYWALRTRKRHQQEHRPQRPTESSDPTQHAKGRTGDRPGPRKGATTRRNVTQGVPPRPKNWAKFAAFRAFVRSRIFSGGFGATYFRPKFSSVPLAPHKVSTTGECGGGLKRSPGGGGGYGWAGMRAKKFVHPKWASHVWLCIPNFIFPFRKSSLVLGGWFSLRGCGVLPPPPPSGG